MIDLREHVYYLHHQESVGCCTASASLLAVEMMYKMNNNPKLFSRLFLYYMTRKAQSRIGLKGAELKTTLDTLKFTGVCREELWPFLKIRENTEPPTPAQEDAKNYCIKDYKSVVADDFKYYLNNRMPIIIGMWTGKKFWKMSGNLNELIYEPINTTDNSISKGHAVTIVGYNDSLCGGSWIIANSLGPRWGDKGYGVLPYLCNDNIGESYTIDTFSSAGN